MSHLALHSNVYSEKIDRSQEIEGWPEMCVKIPQIDYMCPVTHSPHQIRKAMKRPELQIRWGIESNQKLFFSYFSMKTYVVTTYKNPSQRDGSNEGSQHMF